MTIWRTMACSCFLMLLTSCMPVEPARSGAERIVSIDYCADQMVLGLVGTSRIAAVSVEADNDPNFSARLAGTLPRVRPEIEQIMAVRPTLVVRSYGGGPSLAAGLRRIGVPVYTLPIAESISDVRRSVLEAGRRLSASEVAHQLIARFDQQVAGDVSDETVDALYLTPGNVTTGPGTFVATLMAAAGLRSIERRSGWRSLPIEEILMKPPSLIVRGFEESRAHQQDRWAASGNLVFQKALARQETVLIPGSDLACGNWLAGNAIAAMRSARLSLKHRASGR